MKTSTPDYQEKDGYRGENDVSDDKPAPVKPNKKKECSEAALKSMGNRLLDWFSVIKAENRRRPEYKGKGKGFSHFLRVIEFFILRSLFGLNY